MPLVVLQIIRSNAISMDGSRKITVIILIIAPLAISEHMVLIRYTLEYFDTPNVEAKKPSACSYGDINGFPFAQPTHSFGLVPSGHQYRIVHRGTQLNGGDAYRN